MTFTRKDKATGVRTPVDFTGATGKAQIRRTARDVNVLAEFDVSFPDPAAGKVRMFLDAASSQALEPQECVYDLQITRADGQVRTWIAGKMTVLWGVTRP